MNLDGLASTGAAQRSLARLLRTAYADERRAAADVARAMRTARCAALPEDAVELLAFVKAHLVPLMTPEVGPRLVAALLDDLEAEIEHERAMQDPNSSSRMRLSTRMPPVNEEVDSEVRMPTTRAPHIDAMAKDDAAKPTPNPHGHHASRFDATTEEFEVPAALRGVQLAPPPTKRVRRAAVDRPAVALVDGDRFGRSSLARALVQARCDVTVLDGAADLVKVLEGTEPLDVLVTDVDGQEIDAVLGAMHRLRPEIPVLAWTKSARAVAEHVLTAAGVERYDVIGRTARTADVIEGVRKLAGAE